MDNAANDSNNSFLAGFVIGALAGTALALLLAPRSGSDVRARLVGRRTDTQAVPATQTHDGYFGNEHKQTDDKPVYEPPRIILDEGNNVSTNATRGENS